MYQGAARAGSKTPSGAERFWQELVGSFEAAAAAAGVVQRDIRVAGVPLRLRFAGPSLEGALFPAFAHLADEAIGAEAERVVLLFDTASTRIRRPPDAWGPSDVGPLGELSGLQGGPLRGVFDGGYGGLQLFDSRSDTLVYHAPSEDVVPWYERAAPLRAGLHWLLGAPRRHLVHAAAVGASRRGVLLAGAGGSGKSTLAMGCLAAGLDFAGEDYTVVTTKGGPRAHSIYCTAKLDAGSLERLFAGVQPIVSPDLADGEKAVLRLDPQCMQLSLAISAVLLPRVSGASPPRLERVSGGEALLALGPSSIFQLPSRTGDIMRTVGEVARRVPAWRIELGDDVKANVDCVRRSLSGVRSP